jgi:site-specific recombinase XerD
MRYSIYERVINGTRYYYARYVFADGRRAEKILKGVHSRAEADILAPRLGAQLDAGEVAPDSVPGWGKLQERFLASEAKTKAQSTYNDARLAVARFLRWLATAYPKANVRTVTAKHIAAYRDHVLDTGTAKTWLKQRRYLSMFWTWLTARGHAAKNVVIEVKRDKVDDPETEAYTREEIAALLEALRPVGRAVLLTQLSRGLRGKEVCALERRDVDLSHGLLTIKARKSKRHTVAPLPPVAVDALHAVLYLLHDTGPMWPNRRGGVLTRETWADELRAAAKLANVRALKNPVHAVRHTYGTELGRRGVPMRDIQRLLDHASITTTQRYVHPNYSDKDAAAVVNSFVNEKSGKRKPLRE